MSMDDDTERDSQSPEGQGVRYCGWKRRALFYNSQAAEEAKHPNKADPSIMSQQICLPSSSSSVTKALGLVDDDGSQPSPPKRQKTTTDGTIGIPINLSSPVTSVSIPNAAAAPVQASANQGMAVDARPVVLPTYACRSTLWYAPCTINTKELLQRFQETEALGKQDPRWHHVAWLELSQTIQFEMPDQTHEIQLRLRCCANHQACHQKSMAERMQCKQSEHWCSLFLETPSTLYNDRDQLVGAMSLKVLQRHHDIMRPGMATDTQCDCTDDAFYLPNRTHTAFDSLPLEQSDWQTKLPHITIWIGIVRFDESTDHQPLEMIWSMARSNAEVDPKSVPVNEHDVIVATGDGKRLRFAGALLYPLCPWVHMMRTSAIGAATDGVLFEPQATAEMVLWMVEYLLLRRLPSTINQWTHVQWDPFFQLCNRWFTNTKRVSMASISVPSSSSATEGESKTSNGSTTTTIAQHVDGDKEDLHIAPMKRLITLYQYAMARDMKTVQNIQHASIIADMYPESMSRIQTVLQTHVAMTAKRWTEDLIKEQ